MVPIAEYVWRTKYRLNENGIPTDKSITDTWWRVANALAAPEGVCRELWAQRFFSILKDFRFLPGGRILAGAGSSRRVTLFNCFVMGTIEDSLHGIFDALKEGALTMQAGGGVGYDFSTLRAHGELADDAGTTASGPVSFMHVWDAMCATLLSTNARRGAMMATLRCDHTDIERFVDAKRTPGALSHFNLSVLVTDPFMAAVENDQSWTLRSPRKGGPAAERLVSARALWERIMRASYDSAEPGVIFIDRVNALNNLWYCERICATNPCGEIPLPPYGACDLGSINLTQFIDHAFTDRACVQWQAIRDTVKIAVRMLDNVYDVAIFPLEAQARTARLSRRLGIGLTGLGDGLAMLNVRYDSDTAFALAGEIMKTICHAAYLASVKIATEKGSFAQFDADAYLRSAFAATLPDPILEAIRRHGIRNSHLTAIAPTGTISLLAGNVSSGLEPIFRTQHRRIVRLSDGSTTAHDVQDYAYALFRDRFGDQALLPPAFTTAEKIAATSQLQLQAALQRYVDNAISKTVNLPRDISYGDFCSIYDMAYKLGLKGCTAYRPTALRGEVLKEVLRAPSGANTDATLPEDCCSAKLIAS